MTRLILSLNAIFNKLLSLAMLLVKMGIFQNFCRIYLSQD